MSFAKIFTPLATGRATISDFEQLIDRIYQAPTDPEIWPSVLYDISRSVAANGAALITRRNDNWVGWTLSPDLPLAAHEYLQSTEAARSQTTARLIAANHAGFLTDNDLFTDAEYAADPLIADFGAKAGLHHAAATAVIVPNADFLVVQVQRRTGAEAFAAADVARLDALRPHLARAGLLAARWRLERLTAAAAALALVGLAAAVLDQRGTVLAANELMEHLPNVVEWLPHDQIALLDQTANILLRHTITKLNNLAEMRSCSIPIRKSKTSAAAVAHVIPTAGRSRDFFGGGMVLLVITTLSAPAALDIGLVQGLFDLTAAEARLANGIAEGLTLDKIAVRGGISQETVRSQLRAVFAKTGTTRQPALAALLSGVPAVKRGKIQG